MRGSFVAACGVVPMVLVLMAPAAQADLNSVQLKDVTVQRPFSESVVVIGSDGQVRAGMEVSKLTRQISEQADALTELRRKNEELSRKLEEQTQNCRRWSASRATAAAAAMASVTTWTS